MCRRFAPSLARLRCLAAVFAIAVSPCIARTASGQSDTERVGPADAALELTLRSRAAADASEPALRPGDDSTQVIDRREQWEPAQTALIVCDMWDSHHCYRAVQRVEQLVPRMDRVLSDLRSRGVTVIHAPSDCVQFYAEHEARARARNVPKAAELPDQIRQWCHEIPAEERARYPIDQSDGGEDDTPEEHAAWTAELKAQGRDPEAPWQRQHPGLTIDADRDFITDAGDEVWSILEARDIDNVILVGVHTNMCVLGRPFGLRQMAKNGKNVVLMRDMTDTMYNPDAWPHVSHFEGTQRIVRYIERYVCPTITSAQVVGGKPFRFAGQ